MDLRLALPSFIASFLCHASPGWRGPRATCRRLQMEIGNKSLPAGGTALLREEQPERRVYALLIRLRMVAIPARATPSRAAVEPASGTLPAWPPNVPISLH